MHRESPFVKCPVYETGSFKLRLVSIEDAEGLPGIMTAWKMRRPS